MFTEFHGRRADLVLGHRFEPHPHAVWSERAPGKKIIHSTTTPPTSTRNIPSTRRWSAMPRWCSMLWSPRSAGRRAKTGGGNALTSLKEEVATVKRAWLAEWAKHLDSDETPINQYRVIRDLMRTVDRDKRHHHP